MGVFRIAVQVARPGRGTRWVEVSNLVVDSGSEITWVPEHILRELGVGVFKRAETFVTADGRQIVRDVGAALIRHGPFKTVDEVVFAKPGDLRLLGARTLEGFNATVDPRRKRLVAAGPLPAAAA